MIILPWGQHKALSSLIYGTPTKAILRRAFGDIDLASLPTVSEGKALIKVKLAKLQRESPINVKTGGSVPFPSKPARIRSGARPYLPRPVLGGAKVMSRRAVLPVGISRDERQKTVSSQPIKKGWPEAAIIAWEGWGKHNPDRFFQIWSELAMPGLCPSG